MEGEGALGPATLRRRLLEALALAPLAAVAGHGRVHAAAAPVVGLVPPRRLAAALSGPRPPRVIDIRDNGEFAADGGVPGAIGVPYESGAWRREVGGVPGMLPPPDELRRLLARLAIAADLPVVIVGSGRTAYDLAAAARVAWTLAVTGRERVLVLAGGYRAWARARLPPAEARPVMTRRTRADVRWQRHLIADRADVAASIGRPGTVLLDLRPRAQYRGELAPPGIAAAGTLPGARSLPYPELVDPDGRLRVDADGLNGLLEALLVAPGDHLITFCNTGHWAALGWLLLTAVAGRRSVALYDGSMAEWTMTPGAPIVRTSPP